MTPTILELSATAELFTSTRGLPILPASTPLIRLNFVDGRTLRAADLTLEQQGERSLVQAVARAGGWGVVDGLDVDRSGESLTVRPGMAIDPAGRVVLLTEPIANIVIADLIAASVGPAAARPTGPADTAQFVPCTVNYTTQIAPVLPGTSLYLLTIGWLEGLCGHQETFGSPCGSCATEAARPYRIDGAMVRLRPMTLTRSWSVGPGLGDVHLRSLVASAYFADEQNSSRWPMSAGLLNSDDWRHGTGFPPGPAGAEVPLAIVVRRGATTMFEDVWTARRERLEAPGRPAFDLRIGARPSAVFAAQLDQFQAQLSLVADRLGDVDFNQLKYAGFVELPPTGLLPVDPSRPLDVQAAALFGPGVDTALIAVPRDRIAHEIESASHRDRIPLADAAPLDGVLVPVDVLVPDGVTQGAAVDAGRLFTAEATIANGKTVLPFTGTARRLDGSDGSLDVWSAALAGTANAGDARTFVTGVAQASAGQAPAWAVPQPGKPLDTEMLRFMTLSAADRRRRTGQVDSNEFAGRLSAQQAKPLVTRAHLHCDRAPWLAGNLHQQVALSFEFELFAPTGTISTGLALSKTSINGTMTRQPVVLGQPAIWDFEGTIGSSPGSVPERPVVGTVEQTAAGDSWSFTFGPWQVTLAGQPIIGEKMTVTAGKFLLVKLTADRTVADSTNTSRIAAERALEILALASPTYQRAPSGPPQEQLAAWRMELFGSTPDGPAGSTVTGSLDWVAFRRRWVQPTTTVVITDPPIVDPLRTVDLRLVETGSAQAGADMIKKLKKDGGGDVPVTQVRFRTGTADWPEGMADQVDQSVATVTKLPRVLAAGYSPSELPNALQRVAAIRGALVSLEFADTFSVFELGTDHTATAGADGAIVLVMAPAEVKEKVWTLEVYTMAAVGNAWNPIAKVLSSGSRVKLQPLIPKVPMLHLGDISSDNDLVAQQNAFILKLQDLISGQHGAVVDPTPMLWIDKDFSADQVASDKVREFVGNLLAGLVDQAQHALAVREEHIVEPDPTNPVSEWAARVFIAVRSG